MVKDELSAFDLADFTTVSLVGGSTVVVDELLLLGLDKFEQAVVPFHFVLEVGFQIPAGVPPSGHGFG